MMNIYRNKKTAALAFICLMPLILGGCSSRDFLDFFLDPLAKEICIIRNPISEAVEKAFLSGNSVVGPILNANGLDTMRLMLKTCAYGIAGVLCLINIADDMMSTFHIRAFLRGAVKYAVTYAVIEHSVTLCSAVNSTGIKLIDTVMNLVDTTGALPSQAEVKEALIEQFSLSSIYSQSSGPLSLIGDIIGDVFGILFLNSILYFALVIALRVVMIQCLMQCYSAVIEIALLESFLPIGISWMASDGFRGQGGRYLKRLFSSFIKVAMFGIICLLCRAIGTVSISKGILTYMTFMLMISLSAVRMMKECGQIADTIMGV